MSNNEETSTPTREDAIHDYVVAALAHWCSGDIPSKDEEFCIDTDDASTQMAIELLSEALTNIVCKFTVDEDSLTFVLHEPENKFVIRPKET